MPSNFLNFLRPMRITIRKMRGLLVMLKVEDIVANRHQPRKNFQAAKIKELAQSIAKNGLLQPIIVREYEPHQYEIVAGERRFRAVQLLKWPKVQAIIREFDNTSAAIQALNENLQRENLSAIEEAQAYQKLLQLTNKTQESLAAQLGKSQSTVANKLRLLKLDPTIQAAIAAGQLSERQGRELLRLAALDQVTVLKEITENNLNVTQTKALVDQWLTPESPHDQKQTRKSKGKPRAKILNKMDSLILATQTLKQSLKLIEKSGIKVTQQIKQIDQGEIEIMIQLAKNTKDSGKPNLKQSNGGN